MSQHAGPMATRALATIAAGTMLWGALAAPAASAPDRPIDCPTAIPIDEVRQGTIATGWTVAEKDVAEPFQAEVLGVIENAFPGRDLIVVDTSGDVIERHGGIWYGMSGSPVYVGDRLLGAVAFGVTWGPSTLTALTPAEEMLKIFDYPDGGDRSVSSYRGDASMPESLHRRTERETAAQNSGSFRQLRVPVGISGASGRLLDKLRAVVERENLPIVPVQGSAAAATGGAARPLHAADNFAAALSYGDLTFAGVGTTTVVCDGRALAFGHPFFWEGATTLGANAADTIAIAEDVFGSYELATIAEGLGVVDQDRFAGLRADLGAQPPAIPLTSSVTALNTGRNRDGLTTAVISEIVPFLAFAHAYENILFAMDQWSGGSSQLTWTVTGTTASGAAWQLERSNKYASRSGIAGRSTFELAGQLFTLWRNKFEEIEFTGVDIDASVTEQIARYKLTDVLVSKNGTDYREVVQVRARPGRTLFVRAVLAPYEGSEQRTVELEVTIPEGARHDGVLEIASGAPDERGFICLYRPRRCADAQRVESLDELIAALEGAPRNDELLARLRMGPRGRIKAEDVELLDQVVAGKRFIYVSLPGGCCAAGPEEPVASKPVG